MAESVTYPRKYVTRLAARVFGRLVLPLLFDIHVSGWENCPPKGPLLMVGNHTAIMEVVLMTVYSPRIVEMLGSIDIPHERLTNFIAGLYGFIPYKRGFVDRTALRLSLSVLKQDGVVGIFPEGGIWQISERRVQPGVAWLSEKSQAPVLPMYFDGTAGAIQAAKKFKRPKLTITVGKLIPPVSIPAQATPKEILHQYAERVMDAVDDLKPVSVRNQTDRIRDETFWLECQVADQSGKQIFLAPEIEIRHGAALAKLLHYPTILKIFKVNFRMPIDALQKLSTRPSAKAIADACVPILKYMATENPYLLTYRFGPKEGDAMLQGIKELQNLSLWCAQADYTLSVIPFRKYFDVDMKREVVQTEQGEFKDWM